MAIKVQSELLDLIARIRTVSSPLERMRVLTDAWRTIRELSPEERQRLGRYVGGKGADRILERLGSQKGGLRPSELRTAIARARREEGITLQDGVDLLESLLREDDGPVEADGGAAQAPEPSSERAAAREVAGREPEPARAASSETKREPAAPVVATSAATAAAAAAVARVARPADEEIARDADRPPLPERAKTAPPLPRERDEEPEAPPEPEPAPRVAPSKNAARAAAVEPRPWAPPRLPDLPPVPEFPAAVERGRPGEEERWVAEGPAGRIAAAGRADERLRALRDGLEEIAALGDTALAAVLDAFPDGWERRRAVQALIRAGVPDGIDAALALFGHLSGESDRTWCALTLLDERGEDAAARERIAEAVPASQVVRRVRRRR